VDCWPLLEEIPTTATKAVKISPHSPQERNGVLGDWAKAATDFRREATLDKLFAAQVEHTPNAVAVVFGEQRLTYAVLNERVNRLADRLIRLRVRPGTVIGVALDRSVALAVALLAVFKAGGVYLPLDPAHPPARMARMIEDAGAVLVLTTKERSEGATAGRAVLNVDELGELADSIEASGVNDAWRPVPLRPNHLAYIIYTSGSTGRPKGVAVSHRSLANAVLALGAYHGIGEGFCYAMLAAPAFDSSIAQIAVPLVHGGRLVIFDEASRTSPAAFWRLVVRERINLIPCVPAYLATVLDAAPERFRLDHLVVGGEAFPAALLARIRARLQVGRVVNLYGPTEAAIVASGYVAGRSEPGPFLPIGMPLPNQRVYVLDDRMQPVPTGAAAELYVGGLGLAEGYLNQPALTAERFVANPFGPQGSRLYRTGDRVRRRADGVIEFLGREDHQVKIRGQRIELGEVETVLLEHPAVATAAIALRDDRIVAYVVARKAPVPSSELRIHLSDRLPKAMVPAAFVWLEALPLTVSGKLDRRALPLPQWAGEKAYEPPSGPVEELMARLWQELLGVARVGRRDSFFDLGGHSLSAVRLFNEIHRLTGHDLPLSTLFRFRTVEGLASLLSDKGSVIGSLDRLVEAVEATHPWSPLVEISKGAASLPLFCIHGAAGNVLNYYDLARHLGPDRPIYAFEAQGADGRRPPLTRIEDMAALYLSYVRRLQPTGPYLLTGHSDGGVVAFEMAQQLIRAGEDVALLALLDTVHPSVSRRGLSVRQRLRIGRRLGDILPRWLTRRVGRRAMEVRRARQLVRDGISVPHHLREPLIFETFMSALSVYRAERYPNKIYLLQAIEGNSRRFGIGRDWIDVAQDGLEVQDVPGTHLGMMYEPDIGVVATKLRAIIDAEVSKAVVRLVASGR
jgi:amino acid adenylation domain-containing protein